MAEEATWGVGIVVRLILIVAVIIITLFALYHFLVKPVMETLGNKTEEKLEQGLEEYRELPGEGEEGASGEGYGGGGGGGW